MSQHLAAGKLPHDLLAELLATIPPSKHQVSLPPQIGNDAGIFSTQQNLLAVTTDPITFTTDRVGHFSICVNINDLICQGAIPFWYSATLLLPEGFTVDALKHLWHDLCDACERFNIDLVAGHTEVTPAVNCPILVGQMIGEVHYDNTIAPQAIQANDTLLFFGSAGMEGAAILADKQHASLSQTLSKKALDALQQRIFEPGICILDIAKTLLDTGKIVALHDPTEGGVATAIHELADAAGLGIDVDVNAIPVLPDVKQCCDHFDIDPLGLLASGSLLAVCRENDLDTILKASQEKLIPIGQFVSDRNMNIPRFCQDEIVKSL